MSLASPGFLGDDLAEVDAAQGGGEAVVALPEPSPSALLRSGNAPRFLIFPYLMRI